ncbi:MAG: hypothetical protein JRC66_02855 [Deltaproteobacteria bacterium]|nr:hypothetical protein [Deltaproteobacteria bacterium]
MSSRPSIKRIQLSVFLISTAIIAYEVVLFKIFSIQYWHHFAYLIVSIALLGFGSSGAFIFLFKTKLKNNFSTVLYLFPLLLLLSIWINIYLSYVVTFNPLMIIWQPRETLNLLYISLAMFIPFFFGAVCIGLSFSVCPDNIHKIYFSNMTGSGIGSLLILLTVFHLGPYEIILIISIITVCATLTAATSRTRTVVSAIILIVIVPLYFILLHDKPVYMSKFKDLSIARNHMGAEIEAETFGPLGLVTVLESPAYHYLPDLSLNCPFELPEQKGLFLNGNSAGAINRFTGDMEDIRFMDYRTTSLPYKLLNDPDVLVIGGGAGTEILNAKYHTAKDISVVELNADIIRLMQGEYRHFSGDIYNPERCRIFVEDGRGFLQNTKKRFDLIQISLLESMESASAGVYSLNENYLFTTESLKTCLDRLNPGGILNISRWIKNPPRDCIKLLATAISALDAQNAPKSIIMIRSWQTATLLIKNGVFNREEIETAKKFCKSRLFDLCYYPGIKEEETNIVNRLDESYFFLAATRLFSGEGENFYNEYPFHIRPATDDMPFFAHFFKLVVLKKYLGPYGRIAIPLIDWGYILVWIALCILVLLSLILILAPIKLIGGSPRGKMPVFIYFGSLGLAYMFLEMSFLQQFIRYLYDPVFSASVVIGSFLIYSGIGSLIAGRIGTVRPKHVFFAVAFIVTVGIIYMKSDQLLGNTLSGFSLWMRMLICSLLIAPLAVPMGIPFPSGLSRLTGNREGLIPWAWGINGFFSVIGASATVLIAIEWGFKSVVLTALALYILSAVIYRRIGRG